MSMLSKAGTYFAYPESWAIKAEKDKCPRFAIIFKVASIRNGSDWEDVDGEQRITGFFTLFNKDDSPNEINLRSLKDALEWGGDTLSSLESGDWSKTAVQIVVEDHEYNNKKSLEVRYLNHKDYAGASVQKADPQVIQSLDQKYGASIRALFGTKKTNGTNGNGTKQSAPSQPATKAPPSADTADGAKQIAWKSFIDRTPDAESAARIAAFKDVVKQILGPTKEGKPITAEDWKQIGGAIAANYDGATMSLIPF